MDERWEASISLALNALYALAVVIMVGAAVPGLRAGALELWRQQVHAWRYGRWVAGRAPVASWTSLLARDDLPQEAEP